MADSPPLAAATLAVHWGRPDRTPGSPLSIPPVLASTYAEGGPVGYARAGNPTWVALEDVLGALEGGRAVVFGSGMAAVSAVLDALPDHAVVVVPRHAYSGTLALLDQLGSQRAFDVRRVDIADTEQTAAALYSAHLLWIESPTNPMLEVADLPALLSTARRLGVRSCADNTFATPLNQRPLELGADVVVHSITKLLAGHSDVLLGAVVTRDDGFHERTVAHRTLRGAIPGPVEAWIALRGIRTLHLRLDRAQENAGILAERLAEHSAVGRVRYPGLAGDPGHARAAAQMNGFGSILSIELADGVAAADHLCRSTSLWVPATSLGGVESTLERRRRWPDESPTVPDSLVRLSVGIEDVEDLWADLEQALPL